MEVEDFQMGVETGFKLKFGQIEVTCAFLAKWQRLFTFEDEVNYSCQLKNQFGQL
jgi:hypothetical protein